MHFYGKNKKRVLGIIGGSGGYIIEGLIEPTYVKIDSSFGDPSDELFLGLLVESISFSAATDYRFKLNFTYNWSTNVE
jgi:purine nucleoside phosphorylase